MAARARRRAVWIGLLGLGVGYEFHELRDRENGYPLTWLFRWVFRTHHPVGKAVFVGAFGLFSQWFVRHILADAVEAVAEVIEDALDGCPFCGLNHLVEPDCDWAGERLRLSERLRGRFWGDQ